jgi:hypothetical protein
MVKSGVFMEFPMPPRPAPPIAPFPPDLPPDVVAQLQAAGWTGTQRDMASLSNGHRHQPLLHWALVRDHTLVIPLLEAGASLTKESHMGRTFVEELLDFGDLGELEHFLLPVMNHGSPAPRPRPQHGLYPVHKVLQLSLYAPNILPWFEKVMVAFQGAGTDMDGRDGGDRLPLFMAVTMPGFAEALVERGGASLAAGDDRVTLEEWFGSSADPDAARTAYDLLESRLIQRGLGLALPEGAPNALPRLRL